MDRQQIGLRLALQALEMPLSLSTFDERMALQKTVYLCQAAGVHLGYGYNWYLRGPYSPDLTRDAFSLIAMKEFDDDTAGWKLDDPSLRKLEKLKLLWSQKSESDRPKWLELLASVLFLTKSYDGRGKDAAGLREILRLNEKHFTKSEVEEALQELARYGLAT